MSDWQVGDLAVCTKTGAIQCPHFPLALHRGERLPPTTLRVTAITPAAGEISGRLCGCVVLHFEGGKGGVAQRFRKIRPDEHEACEEEFVTLLKRTKRTVSA